MARGRPTAPIDRRRCGARPDNGARSRPRRCAVGGGHGRRRSLAAADATRRGRPGVHPLHLGLDRPAQGGDALARQRPDLPRLVPEALGPWRDGDRFASHAPLHFDLSVFDLFASCQNAATLVLVGEAMGKDPCRLGDFLAERRSDVWYSAPSIWRCWPSTGAWTVPASRPRGWSSSPVRSSRSARCDGCERPGRGPGCGTSTDRPRPTSARPIRSRSRSPPTAIEPYPIGRVCPPLCARVVDAQGHFVPPGTSASS